MHLYFMSLTNNEITQIIRTAGQILRDPAARTVEFYALDQKGDAIDSLDPKACKFCLVGALEKACGYQRLGRLDQIRRLVGRAINTKVDPPVFYVANLWDEGTDEEREVIVQKLLNYGTEVAQ